MQALYLDDGVLSYLGDYARPVAGAGEALIRVRLAGICATDLEMVKGYVAGFSGVLGHEFTGEVAAVGSEADSEWIGRRVVGTINLGCRRCSVCLSTGPEHCPERTVLGIHGKDGVFADYVSLPVVNLLPVPEGLADEAAVFTEPLAAALRIGEQVDIGPGMKMAVVGPGRLGLLIAQVLARSGGEVTVLGRRTESLALPAALSLQTELVTEIGDDSFDFVVEATGNEAGFAQSLRLVRPLGTLVLKSTFAGKANLDLTKLVVAEIKVVGSRCGPFAPALKLLADREVEVQALIEAEYPLREGLVALEHAARPGVRKVLLRP